jgi:hypothetical protein
MSKALARSRRTIVKPISSYEEYLKSYYPTRRPEDTTREEQTGRQIGVTLAREALKTARKTLGELAKRS